MTEIKRYRLEQVRETIDHHALIQGPGGNFLGAEDYDRLVRKVHLIAEALQESFDPGGNLPEDCEEWAGRHCQLIDELEQAVKIP